MKKWNTLFQFTANMLSSSLCMLLVSRDHGIIASCVVLFLISCQAAWQASIMKKTSGLLSLIVIFLCLGFLFDSLLVVNDLIIFNENPFAPYLSPPWMLTQWISFTILFYSTMSFLFTRPLWLGGLSLIGFTFAYAMGVRVGAATFPFGHITSLYIGIHLAILLPLTFCIYHWKITKYD